MIEPKTSLEMTRRALELSKEFDVPVDTVLDLMIRSEKHVKQMMDDPRPVVVPPPTDPYHNFKVNIMSKPVVGPSIPLKTIYQGIDFASGPDSTGVIVGKMEPDGSLSFDVSELQTDVTKAHVYDAPEGGKKIAELEKNEAGFWEVCKLAEEEVAKWPEWKKHMADQALSVHQDED